ncbi:isoprenylcysteine carboxylmethyltransferase family protein [Parasulfuritortus cantonensis]|uniref:Isoprenylcysteine carboxylmethyltransferase family protein n=1 Tax=Parasulfuritortus cantonensis TaxID=2528202 RepID=A0A4R1BF76_9PROT|nr:isoprenylcysteine carboxylmethyltransferase family protein [Parasulfuritortus cantonensis]TCJ15757.1 isoprenylcysteine carboxylmethyltransferase family protein [Parasulfuritortus cantonensis]
MTNRKPKFTLSVVIRIVVWVLMLVGGAAAGIWPDLAFFPHLFANPWWHLGSLVSGVLLLRLVFRMSRVTGRTLARHGREGDLPRMETNRLVTSGPYGCMRHPMHLGLLFFPWAVALLVGSPSFVLFVAPLEMVVMVILVLTLEEWEVARKFGEDYQTYRRRVPPFNLRPDCLRRLLGLDAAEGR